MQGYQDCEMKKDNQKIDYFLISTILTVLLSYLVYYLLNDTNYLPSYLDSFTGAIYELINKIWIGILIGIVSVGLLSKIPKEYVLSILGKGNKLTGILRATLAGVLLDICNHGILMVGMKLYERGASTGQVVAFLVASPWNSFSLTVILYLLIGLKWTIAFIALSFLIALISGIIFEQLVRISWLPENPNQIDLPSDFNLFSDLKTRIKNSKLYFALLKEILIRGLKESSMVMRWILLGVILSGLMRTFLSPEKFESFFGPDLAGLAMTIVVATVLEICSEGSVPIAADILAQANAPGNAFAFLMTGVSTDYTEIMSLKDTTKSWKIALALPLITVPQVILISWLITISS